MIVGAGIIGIPFAIGQSGIIAGIFLLVIVGIMTEKSLRMLTDCTFFNPVMKQHYDVKTYEDLMFCCFGRLGRGFILLIMFVNA